MFQRWQPYVCSRWLSPVDGIRRLLAAWLAPLAGDARAGLGLIGMSEPVGHRGLE